MHKFIDTILTDTNKPIIILVSRPMTNKWPVLQFNTILSNKIN